MNPQWAVDAVVVETLRRTAPGSGRRGVEALAPSLPSAVPATVEFRVLGQLEAVIADRVVDLGRPKQRTLLALLVSQVGRPVTVDSMLEALWSGHPPPSAMTSLQAYVANLRKSLEPDRAPRTPPTVLRTLPQGYVLDARFADVDVHRFDEHAKAGWTALERGDPQKALSEFEAGLALWRGPAYAEVAADLWVAPEIARLDELRSSVFEARCAALLAVGAHGVAAAELEAFIQAHPLREYGCELLALASYRAGRQAAALEVLRTVRTRLAQELGIDPGPALRRLESRILNQSPDLDWQPVPPVAPVSAADGPPIAPQAAASGPRPVPVSPACGEVFVGREAQLLQLTDALTATAAPWGRVVTVSGELGIGKTTLLRRFAEHAGVPVLWATCPEHVETPPMWIWQQLLRALGARAPHHPVPGSVAELLDGDAWRPANGVEVAAATLRRFEAVVQYLTDAADTAPLVVVVENAHRAHPSSLQMLAHLAESVSASRLRLAVSYRSHETAALAETLAALARAETTRIELAGLTVQETQTLASAILRRDVAPRTAEALWTRTEGNPFFLRELIKSLTTQQRLDQPHTAPVPGPVPGPVRDVLLQRVARLPGAVAVLLTVAAVVGRQFDIEVVAEAASLEIEAALESLDAAVAAGLIAEDQQRLGWFRFTHALAAETLCEATGPLRRARLRQRIGAASARIRAGGADPAAQNPRHWQPTAGTDPAAAVLTPHPPHTGWPGSLATSISDSSSRTPPHDGSEAGGRGDGTDPLAAA
jgi:DNA-binding SARP family transcriptional activator